MITLNTNLKLPRKVLTYRTTILAIIFIITLPFSVFLLFLPSILIVIIYFVLLLDYKNTSFLYNEKQIEISKGIFTKSQRAIPFSTVQNINLVSGIIMRWFGLKKIEIWTASPSQIQIFEKRGRGSSTDHKPDGMIILLKEDAEDLKNFITAHK